MTPLARSLLAFLSLWWTSFSAEATSNTSLCLPGGVQRSQRRFVDANQVPLGIWMYDWPSAAITGHIFTIFAEEVGGIHVNHYGPGKSSSTGIYALAGCHAPDNYHADHGCPHDPQMVKHHGHLAFEIWMTAFLNRFETVQQDFHKIAPVVLGDLGYSGRETMFVTQQRYVESYESEGLPLDFYASYDSQWHFADKYFDSITSLPTSSIAWCNQTLMTNELDMKQYIAITGDVDGTEVGHEGSVQGRCFNGKWWLAPACRSAIERCIPVLTGGDGWFLNAFMHAASRYHMPFALGTASSWSAYTELPKQYRLLFYWWRPDPTFILLNPRRVVFPDFDKDKWNAGDKSSVSTNVQLVKLAHAQLESLDVMAFAMAHNFKLSDSQIEDLLVSSRAPGATYQDVACAWIQENSDVWAQWVPDATACILGQGLVDENGRFVQNRTSAVNCEWCPSGTFSRGLSDEHGRTNICASCSPGFHQPQLGKASCKPCPSGSYSNSTGNANCQRCDVGRFQQEVGAFQCDGCPLPLTTSGRGADNKLLDCLCPSTMIQNVDGHCQRCPEGLDCNLGSALTSISCNSKIGAIQKSQTRLNPSYMSQCSMPLSVYRCLSIEACPGGDLGHCGVGFEGIACGRCKKGMFLRGGGCVDCSDQDKSLFILCMTIFAVSSPILIIAISVLTASAGTNLRPKFWDFLSCIFYLFVINCEFIATCARCDLKPDGSNKFLTQMGVFLSPLDLLHPDCLESLSFQGLFVIHLFTPLGVAAAFLLTYSLAFLASMIYPMLRLDWNVGFGTYGSLFLMFSISIFQRGTSWFQCYQHPNGEWSLRIDPNTLCYVEDWRILAATSAVAMLIFTLGGWAALVYSVCYARVHIGEASFRKRWRFMFVKFRATAWWWGLVLLAQGLCLSFVVVVSGNAAVQLFLICVMLIVYSIACCVVVPWRNPGIWALDIFIHVSLTLLCATLFTGRRQATDDDAVVRWMSWGVFLLPFLFGIGVFVAQVRLKSTYKEFDFDSQSKALARGFSRALQVELMQSILQRLPPYDVMQLILAKNIVVAEIDALTSSPRKAEEGSSRPSEVSIVPQAFNGQRRLSFRSDSVQPVSPEGSEDGFLAATMRTSSAYAAYSTSKAMDMQRFDSIDPGMVVDGEQNHAAENVSLS